MEVYAKKQRGLIPIACSESPTKGCITKQKGTPTFTAGVSTLLSCNALKKLVVFSEQEIFKAKRYILNVFNSFF